MNVFFSYIIAVALFFSPLSIFSSKKEEASEKTEQKKVEQNNHIGLDNLGNTCFLNVTVQTLRVALRDVFADKD